MTKIMFVDSFRLCITIVIVAYTIEGIHTSTVLASTCTKVYKQQVSQNKRPYNSNINRFPCNHALKVIHGRHTIYGIVQCLLDSVE